MGKQISSVHLPDITAIAPGRFPYEDRFNALVPDSLCRHHRPHLSRGGPLAAKRDGLCLYPTAHPVGQKTAAKKDELNPALKDPREPIVAGRLDTNLERPPPTVPKSQGGQATRVILHNEKSDQSNQKN